MATLPPLERQLTSHKWEEAEKNLNHSSKSYCFVQIKWLYENELDRIPNSVIVHILNGKKIYWKLTNNIGNNNIVRRYYKVRDCDIERNKVEEEIYEIVTLALKEKKYTTRNTL